MEIKILEHQDLQYIPSLQPPEWGNILPRIEFYLESDFCFPIKIEIDGQLVGIGASILHRDTIWLAHIIVHTDFRNKGIGKLITRTLTDRVDRKKYETIYLIATDLGAPVYTALGFETETTYAFFKDGRSDFKIHSSIRKAGLHDHENILRLDAIATGEERREFLNGYMHDASIFETEGRLSGFYLPSLIDGPIIADNKEAGIELMKLRLQTEAVAILPDDNKEGITFLKQNNYKEFRKAKRMRLGKKRDWHPEFYYNRISGQVG